MIHADDNVLPLAIYIELTNHTEMNLIEPLIDSAVTSYIPDKLIDEQATDAEPLRQRLVDRDIGLICPHRRGRVRPATPGGRKL